MYINLSTWPSSTNQQAPVPLESTVINKTNLGNPIPSALAGTETCLTMVSGLLEVAEAADSQAGLGVTRGRPGPESGPDAAPDLTGTGKTPGAHRGVTRGPFCKDCLPWWFPNVIFLKNQREICLRCGSWPSIPGPDADTRPSGTPLESPAL